MNFPLEIEFRNLERSEFVEGAVTERARKLEQFGSDVLRCKVTIAAPHKHHNKGNLYQVSIIVHVPGTEIVVSREPSREHGHEDAYVAIRDAFNAAARQLQDYVRVRRGEVKVHEAPPHGIVSELHPDQDYGRIAASDGRQIYFHRNSLLSWKLEELAVGDEVRFDEEAGEQGPQASSVRRIGKHHIVE